MEKERKYIICEIGQEKFAFDAAEVRDVLSQFDIIRFPTTPHFICGVTSHNGRPVPLIDIAGKLGIDTNDQIGNTILTFDLNSEFNALTFGCLINGISDVMQLKNSEIKAPPIKDDLTADFIKGMVEKDGRSLAILDARQLIYKQPNTPKT